MRISDWSSDVCSSDLSGTGTDHGVADGGDFVPGQRSLYRQLGEELARDSAREQAIATVLERLETTVDDGLVIRELHLACGARVALDSLATAIGRHAGAGRPGGG